MQMRLVIIAQLVCHTLMAQHTGIDSNYIAKYTDKLCVTLVCNNNNMSLNYKDKLHANRLTYTTNVANSWGIGVDYKWLTLEFTTNLQNKSASKIDKGATNITSLSFGLTGQKWWFSSYLRYYTGMYLKNVEDFDQGYVVRNKRYPTRGDIEAGTLYASLVRSFNSKKYTHMASLWQLDVQKKSAGSAVAGVAVQFNVMQNDSGLTPSSYGNLFDIWNNILYSHTTSFILKAGYAHTFVYKQKYFLHLSAIPGLAFQKIVNQNTLLQVTERNRVGMATHFRFSGGYNSKKYYGGVALHFNQLSNTLDEAHKLDYDMLLVRFFVGKRFGVKLW